MAVQNTKKWFDIIALVAVLGGLVLVAFEIRQSNSFAKAATENSLYQGWESLAMAEIETGINEIRVKAILDPEGMSANELAEIGSYLTAVISLYQRNGIMFSEYGLAFEPDYADVGPFYFVDQASRTWFKWNETWIRNDTPELAEEIRHYIDSTPVYSASAAGWVSEYLSRPTD